MFQNSEDHGFPAAFAPLPTFEPEYTLDRPFSVQPRATDTWTMPTLDLKYSGTGWSVVWANAYFYRHTQDIEDSSYGTQQVLTGPIYLMTGVPAQPYLWIGDRNHDQVTSEMRFSFDPIHNWSGTLRSLLLQHPYTLHDSADLRERSVRTRDDVLLLRQPAVPLHRTKPGVAHE